MNGLPATGIPALDALIARLPQEAERFQRIPARLAAATSALNRAPGSVQQAVQGVRDRIGRATANYARLASIVADMLAVYRERRPLQAPEVAKGLALVVGVPDLHKQVEGIERDTQELAAGRAVVSVGTGVRVVAGAGIGYLIGRGIGAVIGAALGFLTAARRS